jgi:hypothetical protein
VSKVGVIGAAACEVMRSSIGVVRCGALDATSCLPPGRVPLQQSSALDEGTHFPFLQQSAAFCVNCPLLKQSNGFKSRRTAITLTDM